MLQPVGQVVEGEPFAVQQPQQQAGIDVAAAGGHHQPRQGVTDGTVGAAASVLVAGAGLLLFGALGTWRSRTALGGKAE
ncbi:hypothetical protein GCM10010171_56600 [Actinokineospora fastidiosa]|uniref:Uncharacterized protein n=1 Tax=Actinokineospora fastidiosa TaxID=1816 RepID=A0A918LJ39_9PSEU|nr:hypothetical protein GCM10010171_56600 [Actinokineospora fastidiosa]